MREGRYNVSNFKESLAGQCMRSEVHSRSPVERLLVIDLTLLSRDGRVFRVIRMRSAAWGANSLSHQNIG
jgi:hypothetical protein